MEKSSLAAKASTVVLVTGASGYLGSHCVQQLLTAGYTVRGTVRSIKNETKCKPLRTIADEVLKKRTTQELQLVEADLLNSDWFEIVQGCTYVLHVASPFPITADESTVTTAVNGTINVLRACALKYSGVQKVVLTSSCAAVNEGHLDDNIVYNEESWSSTNPKLVEYYPRSKTEAEKAAWNFVNQLTKDQNQFRLTCLNPTLIIGPILTNSPCTSITIIRRLFSYSMPVMPALHFPLVDVRDVANAHIRAMLNKDSDGQRILLSAQPSFWYRDLAKVLGNEFRPQGYFVSRLQAPYVAIWLASFFDPDARVSLSRINRKNNFDATKAKAILKIEFRKPEKSLIEMAYSMIERGIIPKKEYSSTSKNADN